MPAKKPRISRKGPPQLEGAYTLLEILVALTIIGLIFSFGFASFRDFSRRQQVVSARRKLDGELRLAQERAISGEKPVGVACDAPNILIGYNFRVTSSSVYTIEALCTGGAILVRTTELSGGITISTPSPNPILFKVLGQGTNIPAGSTTLTLTQAETGSTQAITLSASGEIK